VRFHSLMAIPVSAMIGTIDRFHERTGQSDHYDRSVGRVLTRLICRVEFRRHVGSPVFRYSENPIVRLR
jgi:hypothetical protein